MAREDWTRRLVIQGIGGVAAGAVLTRSGLVGCDDPAISDGDGDDTGVPSGVPDVVLSKPPFTQVVADGVRIRFETREEVAVPVTLRDETGAEIATPEVVQTGREVVFVRDNYGNEDILPDEPGWHVLHEAVFTGLTAGAVYGWSVDLGGGVTVDGSFRAPPALGEAFTFGWLSDTMFPFTDETVAMLAPTAPDLLLHGGDLQYESSPLDTWNGMFRSLVPLTSQAPFHACLGNHEDEGLGEISDMFERLLGGAGDSGTIRHHAFTYGGIRFLMLDSETVGLSDTSTEQYAWLQAELEAADADEGIRFPIVCFHRPLYTLSKHFTSNDGARNAIHPLMVAHGVPLVLFGHAHCFEHFDVDGVHYVVDGTGGSLLYSADEAIERASESHPDHLEKRLYASVIHGTTLVEVGADGTLTVRRFTVEGDEEHTFVV